MWFLCEQIFKTDFLIISPIKIHIPKALNIEILATTLFIYLGDWRTLDTHSQIKLLSFLFFRVILWQIINKIIF